MLTKFLDPKNDLAFRRVFGTEKNKDILIHFLSDILNHQDIGEIKDVTFGPSVPDSEIIAEKKGIVQVLCQDKNGLQCLVAMYVAETNKLYQQGRYYAADIYNSPLDDKCDPQRYEGVASIFITNFDMFPGKSAVQSEHVYLDSKTLEHHLKGFSFTVIDLPKFTKKVEELTDIREKWYYYLRHAPETTPEVYAKLVKDAPILERAYQELEASSWSAEDLAIYEQIKKRDRDSASMSLA